MSRYGDIAKNTGNAENRRCSRQRVLDGSIPKAHAKLWRIVEREGNPDGKRLTVDYAVQLIAEQIEAGRMADFTLKEAAV